LNRIRLWAVAQRVLDQLPTGASQVTLVGDPDVRGFGDESTLFEITGTLVRRALAHITQHAGTTITIHVYAHDTEARLTVHDPSANTSEPPLGDPFSPGLTLGRPGQSGLLLTAVRHAVVRMGGTLSYVPRTRAGHAFRVRLRLAQPT
jgi:C4-dicarboxylate-specific signal transduction histidine kinase